MFTLNRHAVIVKVKKPFVDWLNKNPQIVLEKDGPFTVAKLNQTPFVFLVPFVGKGEKVGRKLFKRKIQVSKSWLFASMLQMWEHNQNKWPSKEQIFFGFEEWFEAQPASRLFDVGEDDITQEPHEFPFPETIEEVWNDLPDEPARQKRKRKK